MVMRKINLVNFTTKFGNSELSIAKLSWSLDEQSTVLSMFLAIEYTVEGKVVSNV